MKKLTNLLLAGILAIGSLNLAFAQEFPEYKESKYEKKAERKGVPAYTLYLDEIGFENSPGSLPSILNKSYTKELPNGNVQAISKIPNTKYFALGTAGIQNVARMQALQNGNAYIGMKEEELKSIDKNSNYILGDE